MTLPDLLSALQPLVECFSALNVPYFIGGSVASSAYGVARSTLDIDVVADLEESHVEPLVARLIDTYYIDAGMIRRALSNRSSFNIIHLATMMKVDIFILKETLYDREAFRRRRLDTLDEACDAAQVFLGTPEDIILHKLWWYRLGGGVSERQWSDIIGVIEVQAENLDHAYLRQWAVQLELQDLLEQALERSKP